MDTKKKMGEPSFPLRQGDLDWFCSIYAVLNLFGLRGSISVKSAGVFFEEILAAVRNSENAEKKSDRGNLLDLTTKGCNPEDLNWFVGLLSEVGDFNIKVDKTPSIEIVKKAAARGGAVIFFSDASDESDFTHYTVVYSKNGGQIKLFDSFGFKDISLKNECWEIDEYPIQIEAVYSIIPNA